MKWDQCCEEVRTQTDRQTDRRRASGGLLEEAALNQDLNGAKVWAVESWRSPTRRDSPCKEPE